MNGRITRSVVWLAVCTCVVWGHGGTVRGDEYSDLRSQWFKQNDAEEHRAAQRTASRMVQLANQGQGGRSGRADSLYFLAESLRFQGEYETALPLAEKSLRFYLQIYPEKHEDVGFGYYQWGLILGALEKYEESVKALAKAVEIRIAVDGEESARVGHAALSLGTALMNFGVSTENEQRLEESATALEAALEAFTATEGALGRNTASTRLKLGRVYGNLGRTEDAVAEFTRAGQIYIHNDGAQAATVGDVLWYGGNMFMDAEQYQDAVETYQEAIKIYRVAYNDEHTEVGETLGRLAQAQRMNDEPDDAVESFKEAIRIYQRNGYDLDEDPIIELRWTLGQAYLDLESGEDSVRIFSKLMPLYLEWYGQEDIDVGTLAMNLGIGYRHMGKTDQAEKFLKQSRAVYAKTDDASVSDLCSAISELGWVYDMQGDFEKALGLFQEALRLANAEYGDDDIETGWAAQNLGLLHQRWMHDDEALEQYQVALNIHEKTYGPDHIDVAVCINNLAGVYHNQGRYAEAKPLYDRAMTLYAMHEKDESPIAALTIRNLAEIYNDQGNIAMAMEMARKAFRIYEREYGPEHYEVASCHNTLANVYVATSDYEKARRHFQRGLEISEVHYPSERDQIGGYKYGLATVLRAEERYDEAEQQYLEVLQIYRDAFGEDHRETNVIYHDLAELMFEVERYDEAQKYLDRCTPFYERTLSDRHPLRAWLWHDQAALWHVQGRDEDAERLIDRAILLRERLGVAASLRYASYLVRAEIHWAKGRQNEAINDLEDAIRCAEEQRGAGFGSGREKANLFSIFTEAYERMVEWQLERGNMSDAFEAIEKVRTQSLRDQFYYVQFANLENDVPGDEREQELHSAIAKLDEEIRQATRGSAEVTQLREARSQKTQELYEWKRDQMQTRVERAQGALGQERTRQMRQIQRDVVGDGDLMLLYLLGDYGSYVMVVEKDSARLEAITVDGPAARVLGVTPGPLTSEMMDRIINHKPADGVTDESPGIMLQIKHNDVGTDVSAKLAALWRVIVPAAERERLTGDAIDRLFVVPDGSLALLPLETLIVESGRDPKYFLDVGPPIVYGPSATMIHNAMFSTVAAANAESIRVVSVGDPTYGAPPTAETSDSDTSTRYAAIGAELTPLPYSGRESGWVKESFDHPNVAFEQLIKQDATEAKVRAAIEGTQVLHLACHGSTESQYGNLFGALRLSPGPNATIEPSDDGLLRLDEIYQLDLDGCEVAILSACDTNYGPQQKGEGVWSLSRGFLVAGSQRVVASNWLVDDEAAANLISVYCSGIAGKMAAGEAAVDHATALHDAKRWVRRHSKWKSPYYWATFVLVGRS